MASLTGFHWAIQPFTDTMRRNNHKIPQNLQDVFEQKNNTELISGLIIGPFSHPPFEQFEIYPISLSDIWSDSKE